MADYIIFAILAIVTLVSTYQMVRVRLITHAALFMALAFTSVAGIYLMLQAEFVAAIQVLVYAGAITTMVIFAIMLSGLQDIKAERTKGKMWSKSDPVVLVVGAIFAAFMSYLYVTAGLPAGDPAVKSAANVREIGKYLFSTYTLPFEIASILLLIAMVGAIILTAKEAEQQ